MLQARIYVLLGVLLVTWLTLSGKARILPFLNFSISQPTDTTRYHARDLVCNVP